MASTLDARTTGSFTQVLRWPADHEELQSARRDGVPRLMLVDPGEAPPAGHDVLEDWVRMPATDEDIRWRVEVLEHRARSHASDPPVLDPGGLLRVGDRIAVLTPIEHRLADV